MMKTYSNFNEMFTASSGVKSDLSVFNHKASYTFRRKVLPNEYIDSTVYVEIPDGDDAGKQAHYAGCDVEWVKQDSAVKRHFTLLSKLPKEVADTLSACSRNGFLKDSDVWFLEGEARECAERTVISALKKEGYDEDELAMVLENTYKLTEYSDRLDFVHANDAGFGVDDDEE